MNNGGCVSVLLSLEIVWISWKDILVEGLNFIGLEGMHFEVIYSKSELFV